MPCRERASFSEVHVASAGIDPGGARGPSATSTNAAPIPRLAPVTRAVRFAQSIRARPPAHPFVSMPGLPWQREVWTMNGPVVRQLLTSAAIDRAAGGGPGRSAGPGEGGRAHRGRAADHRVDRRLRPRRHALRRLPESRRDPPLIASDVTLATWAIQSASGCVPCASTFPCGRGHRRAARSGAQRRAPGRSVRRAERHRHPPRHRAPAHGPVGPRPHRPAPLPLNATYHYTNDSTGAGVTAYVIDTGIRATHTTSAGASPLATRASTTVAARRTATVTAPTSPARSAARPTAWPST